MGVTGFKKWGGISWAGEYGKRLPFPNSSGASGEEYLSKAVDSHYEIEVESFSSCCLTDPPKGTGRI